jgi:hypothetical protein
VGAEGKLLELNMRVPALSKLRVGDNYQKSRGTGRLNKESLKPMWEVIGKVHNANSNSPSSSSSSSGSRFRLPLDIIEQGGKGGF